MHEGVRREVVEVESVEEHEAPNEGMEREAQSSDEVRNENHPLAWFGGGDHLALLWGAMEDVGGEVAGVLEIPDVLVCDRGCFPLAAGHG